MLQCSGILCLLLLRNKMAAAFLAPSKPMWLYNVYGVYSLCLWRLLFVYGVYSLCLYGPLSTPSRAARRHIIFIWFHPALLRQRLDRCGRLYGDVAIMTADK